SRAQARCRRGDDEAPVRDDVCGRRGGEDARPAGCAGRTGRRPERLHDGRSGRVKILGIDPGLRITGFGVIEQTAGRLRYITSGCVKSGAGDLPARLKSILDGIAEVIAANRPHEVAIEKVFVNVNPQSTLLLGQARGTAICAAVIAGLPVAEYTALQVKQA